MTIGVKVAYSYLDQEYAYWKASAREVLADIHEQVAQGWFTMGPYVQEFEEAVALACSYPFAVAVGSGTDALCLAMKACGIGPGWNIYTPANTFMASVGAIFMAGANPRLADVGPDYLMDETTIPGTSMGTGVQIGVMPVELTGRPFVKPLGLHGGTKPFVIMDAAQSIGARGGYEPEIRCLSLHPLKNVHVWGDGGVVLTNQRDVAVKVRLLRNHGSEHRDIVLIPGHNSRLDNLQARVALWSLSRLEWVTSRRNGNARFYDEHLAEIEGVVLPPRDLSIREAFHTYVIQVDRRAELIEYLLREGVETKIHYPIPLHLQPGFARLGYKTGAFPVAEAQAGRILSLPIHEYLSEEQLAHVTSCIQWFYLCG